MMLYKKHKSKSSITRWRHRLHWHCCRCAAKRYISLIPVYYLPRLHASSIYRFNERKRLCTKERSRRYPAQTITDTDYTDDIVLLPNTPPGRILLHSLGQAAGGIGLHVNTDKREYLCFNQRVDISTLNVGFLKLVNKFTCLGSSISSTENDISMRLAKAWTAINRLLVHIEDRSVWW